jgi:hypothetical protein
VMEIHPYLPYVLEPYKGIIGLCTVLLSLISIALIWYMNLHAQRIKV